MGNFGSSIGLKTAEKLSQETFDALEKLKISESTQNLTHTIERLAHPPGPIDFRVELDISDDVARLATMFFVALCLGLFVALILILACWRISTTSKTYRVEPEDIENPMTISSSKI